MMFLIIVLILLSMLFTYKSYKTRSKNFMLPATGLV